jgi:DNA invertase Pin-like site-specific DNA recombinase
MKVALYARVSRADKDQEPENQLRKLREFAKSHEWEVFSEYKDFASGQAPIRPQLNRMINQARAKHFDTILIVRLDRLARSTKQLLNLLDEMDRFGIDLICTDQDIDTKSPAGKLLFTVLGAVAELELDLIRERTKDGLERARAQGKRLGRPPNKARDEEIDALRARGLSYRQIGVQLGLSHQAVKQRLRRMRVRNRDGKAECVQPPAN